MNIFIKRIGLVGAAFVALGFGQATMGLSAYAAEQDATADAAASAIPLDFIPECSDAAKGIAYWSVVNKNTSDVAYIWANKDGVELNGTDSQSDAGIETAPAATADRPSTSTLETSYYAGKNNETKFTYAGSNESIISRNAASSSCDATTMPVTPPTTDPSQPTGPTMPTTPAQPAACVEGQYASNLHVTWNNNGQIMIKTEGGLPLCNDVDLYYSTYRMPDTYDGRGFYPDNSGIANDTAYPQTLLQSYHFTLEKGTYGSWLENVPTPDYCYNVQADLYYAPEIQTVGVNGHGTQNIASQIFTRDASQCTPGRGAGSTTPTSVTPTALPDTGVENLGSNVLGSLLTLAFGAGSLMALGIRTLRQN